MGDYSKAIALVLASTIFASFGQVLVKMGADRLSPNVISLVTNYPLIFGEMLYGVGAVLLIVSLRFGDLSVIYPIYAMNFIWVGILSPLFFETDSMSFMKWFGIAFIVLGVSLVGYGGRGDNI